MSREYFISVPESTEICEGFGMFYNEMSNCTGDLDISIQNLITLESFTGKAAQSIKDYFAEVHEVLLALIDEAIAELDKVYSCEFHGDLLDASEDARGAFPSAGMKSVAKSYASIAAHDISPVDTLIRRAQSAAPAGYSFYTPGTASLRNSLDEEGFRIDEYRKDILAVEEQGIIALANADEVYNRLFNALTKAISYCVNGDVDMASYSSGDFKNLTADLGLHDLYLEAQQDLYENSDRIMEVKEQAIEDRRIDIEIARQEAAKEKEKWAWIGTGLQAVLVGVAIAGVIASGGALALAFSAVALGSSVYGLGQRAGQLSAMKRNAGADIDDDSMSTMLSGTGKLKDPLSKLESISHDAHIRGKISSSNGSEAFKTHYTNMTYESTLNTAEHFVVDRIVDGMSEAADETFGKNLEGDGKLAYDLGKKVTKKGIGEASDKVIDGSLKKLKVHPDSPYKSVGKAAGVIGFVAEAGQIVSDHYVEVNDKKIDECDAKSAQLDKYQDSLYNVQHSYGAAW